MLSLGVVDRGVPGILEVGEVTRDEAQLEDAPLMYPLVLEVPTDSVDALPPLSDLTGAGSNI